jgi:hypothetical protein
MEARIMRRRTTIALGLTLLLLATATSPLTAAEEPSSPFPDRIRLSHRSHNPADLQLSPSGEWIFYRDASASNLYLVDLANGGRRRIGRANSAKVEFTPDGTGLLVYTPTTSPFLRRTKLESGPVDGLAEPLSFRQQFSTTHDGLSMVYLAPDNTITWWDEDGTTSPLVTIAETSVGFAGAPDRDLILYVEFNLAAESITIKGVTSTGVVTDYGAITGLAGSMPAEFDGAAFTFLPTQDRAIVTLDLRGGEVAETAWIVDLVTDDLEFAAPAITHIVSPDESTAFFEVDDGSEKYGRIVPTPTPAAAFDLPNRAADDWAVHPDWTFVAEIDRFGSGSTVAIYTIGGTRVGGIDRGVAIEGAVFIGDSIVTSETDIAETVVMSYPTAGGEGAQLNAPATTVWLRGGHDGFVYWAELRNTRWSLWRSRPDGAIRSRITRLLGSLPFAELPSESGTLVFEADDVLWAIDLDALPPYACVNRVATHVGTNRSEVIDGTPGDDVIVGLGGNDILRGGEGRDRLCGNHGEDRITGEADDDWLRGGIGDDTLFGKGGDDNILDNQGTNDTDGGAGTDMCRVTGVVAGCELP